MSLGGLAQQDPSPENSEDEGGSDHLSQEGALACLVAEDAHPSPPAGRPTDGTGHHQRPFRDALQAAPGQELVQAEEEER
eukprot:CAMPEP_0170172900 /NCGR_PEP_ID=MMETSP0040_2-20121228/6165_1 /TAXON_ID=641309 /ORGANISM="Lotharella oceanica, Strain CCMP622" /LENGTH=79 /DNA_ID=CAMNT_0010413791 /DNA_START=195 /DNA_END=434 /DNA_ORIENTATION=+